LNTVLSYTTIFLNDFHPSIKFTYEISNKEAHFLDVTVLKDKNGLIQTSLYTKPTDAHMELHYTSHHPIHQKKSIPYSQAVRIRRICSSGENFDICTENLFKNLRMRGYPCKLIKHAISKARKMNRNNLFPHKEKRNQDKQIIPFITTYNPFVPPAQKIFNIFLMILQENRSINFIKMPKL
jgi:hypothetical protein